MVNLMQNPMMLMQRLNQFRATLQGNPQQEVMRLLQSGRISQAQLNEAQRMASQIQQMLSGLK